MSSMADMLQQKWIQSHL